MSDGNETNNAAAVTENASETTGETAETHLPHEPHEPHIQILKGQPTDEELAALIAVLGGVGGGAVEPAQPERTRWGLPVDRLRYAMSNYQRLTLQQMTHLKQ